MIILDATTKSLEIVLTGVVTTSEIDITCHAIETLDSSMAVADLIETNTRSNGVTPVTIMAAPATGRTREIKLLTIFNADTTAKTYKLQINESGAKYIMTQTTLETKESFLGD